MNTYIERFKNFVSELTELSLKYGITIQSVGGITIFEEGELKQVEYSDDYTSGDLIPFHKYHP